MTKNCNLSNFFDLKKLLTGDEEQLCNLIKLLLCLSSISSIKDNHINSISILNSDIQNEYFSSVDLFIQMDYGTNDELNNAIDMNNLDDIHLSDSIMQYVKVAQNEMAKTQLQKKNETIPQEEKQNGLNSFSVFEQKKEIKINDTTNNKQVNLPKKEDEKKNQNISSNSNINLNRNNTINTSNKITNEKVPPKVNNFTNQTLMKKTVSQQINSLNNQINNNKNAQNNFNYNQNNFQGNNQEVSVTVTVEKQTFGNAIKFEKGNNQVPTNSNINNNNIKVDKNIIPKQNNIRENIKKNVTISDKDRDIILKSNSQMNPVIDNQNKYDNENNILSQAKQIFPKTGNFTSGQFVPQSEINLFLSGGDFLKRKIDILDETIIKNSEMYNVVIDRYEKEKKDLLSQIENLKNTNSIEQDKLKNELITTQKNYQDLLIIKNNLETENNSMQDQVNEIAELKNQLEEVNTQLKEKDNENCELKKYTFELKGQNKKEIENIKLQMNQEISLLNEKIKEGEGNKNIMNEYITLKKEIEQYKNIKNTLEMENYQLQNDSNNYQEKIQKEINTNNELKTKVITLEKRLKSDPYMAKEILSRTLYDFASKIMMENN